VVRRSIVDSVPERSTAALRGFSPALSRSMVIGGLVASGVAFVLSLAVVDPSTLFLGPPLIAIASALVGTVIAVVTFPRRLARAFAAYSWLGRTEIDRFVARTGGPVPTRPADWDAWLVAYPPTPTFLLPRIELLAFAGRHEEARREMAAADAASAGSAGERASLRQYVDWLQTGSLDLTELTTAVAPLPAGSRDRQIGETSLALAQSRDRFMAGDPEWYAPLEAARSTLGSAPTGVVLRDTWRPVAAAYALIGLAVSLIVSLSRLLL
jgi:hypothetical protein